jgi:chromosome segregation ATPase
MDRANANGTDADDRRPLRRSEADARIAAHLKQFYSDALGPRMAFQQRALTRLAEEAEATASEVERLMVRVRDLEQLTTRERGRITEVFSQASQLAGRMDSQRRVVENELRSEVEHLCEESSAQHSRLAELERWAAGPWWSRLFSGPPK